MAQECTKFNEAIKIEVGIEKQQHPVATQDYEFLGQNIPQMIDGMFWNVNQTLNSKTSVNTNFHYDPEMERYILKQHFMVIKYYFLEYLQNEEWDQGDNFGVLGQLSDFAFDLGKDRKGSIESFLNIMLRSNGRRINKKQKLNLQRIIYENPLYIKLFQVFLQAVPAFCKDRLSYWMYKALQMKEEFQEIEKEKQLNVQEFVRQKIERGQEKFGNTWQQLSENLKFLLNVVALSTILGAKGKSTNKYYSEISFDKQSYQNMQKTKFQKEFMKKQCKAKKITILRRPKINSLKQKSILVLDS